MISNTIVGMKSRSTETTDHVEKQISALLLALNVVFFFLLALSSRRLSGPRGRKERLVVTRVFQFCFLLDRFAHGDHRQRNAKKKQQHNLERSNDGDGPCDLLVTKTLVRYSRKNFVIVFMACSRSKNSRRAQ